MGCATCPNCQAEIHRRQDSVASTVVNLNRSSDATEADTGTTQFGGVHRHYITKNAQTPAAIMEEDLSLIHI